MAGKEQEGGDKNIKDVLRGWDRNKRS